MKTNFLRSTVILVLILIIPIIFLGLQLVEKYSLQKANWHYLGGILIIIIFSIIFLAGISLLTFSLFFAKSPVIKKEE